MRGLCSLLTLVLLLPAISSGLSSFSSHPDSMEMTAPGPKEIERINPGMPGAFSAGNATTNTSGPGFPALRLSEFSPSFPGEYATLMNYSPSTLSLSNWTLSDGEGTIVFGPNLTLASGSEMLLCENSTTLSQIYQGKTIVEIGEGGLKERGRFQLADAGDEVLLIDPEGMLVDAAVYGDSDYSGKGWMGKPIERIPKGKAAVRSFASIFGDSNSSKDWVILPPGRSNFSPIESVGLVEPFSAPEDALGRLLREFRFAEHSISAAVYEFDDSRVLMSLLECANRGVEVRLLLEGQPVGGLSEDSKAAAWMLAEAGCDVRFMKSLDAYRRYGFLHAKLAVMDERRTVIMSENWVSGGISQNRGWGVIVEDPSTALYLLEVFESDFMTSLDVRAADEIITTPPDLDLGEEELDQGPIPVGDIPRFRGRIRPLISPDFSLEGVAGLLRSAESRILVQQFYCDPKWMEEGSLVPFLFEAASRGVSVRVLLDSSWFNTQGGEGNNLTVQRMNERARELSIDLEARLVSPYHPFGLVHNKGLVVDNTTIVSSMNWAQPSFFENREVGFEIESHEVASFFADIFWQDWAVDPSPPVIMLQSAFIVVNEGSPIWLDASRCYDNVAISNYTWDEGADGIVDWTGPRNLVHLGPGRHVVELIVMDSFNNTARASIVVVVNERGDRSDASFLLSLPLALGAIALSAYALRKRIKGRK